MKAFANVVEVMEAVTGNKEECEMDNSVLGMEVATGHKEGREVSYSVLEKAFEMPNGMAEMFDREALKVIHIANFLQMVLMLVRKYRVPQSQYNDVLMVAYCKLANKVEVEKGVNFDRSYAYVVVQHVCCDICGYGRCVTGEDGKKTTTVKGRCGREVAYDPVIHDQEKEEFFSNSNYSVEEMKITLAYMIKMGKLDPKLLWLIIVMEDRNLIGIDACDVLLVKAGLSMGNFSTKRSRIKESFKYTLRALDRQDFRCDVNGYIQMVEKTIRDANNEARRLLDKKLYSLRSKNFCPDTI